VTSRTLTRDDIREESIASRQRTADSATANAVASHSR
jgi:hypothetical protein